MKFFLISGNSRVGSTWLSTSLHFLPGLDCRGEIRWQMPYQEQVHPVHVLLDARTISMRQRIDQACSERPKGQYQAIGSRLKFDPYGFAHPETFKRIRDITEEDIRIFLLRRNYADIFQTWKVFGIRHLANAEISGFDPQHKWLVDRFGQSHSIPPEQKWLFLTGPDDELLSDLGEYEPSKVIRYPLTEAITDVLVLFYNDLQAYNALNHVENLRIINYTDIEDTFATIANSLSEKITGTDCDQVLRNPLSRKIEPNDTQLTYPTDAINDISRYLDDRFSDFVHRKVELEEMVKYDPEGLGITFDLPGLTNILRNHPETARIEVGAGENTKLVPPGAMYCSGYWHARRQIYRPIY